MAKDEIIGFKESLPCLLCGRYHTIDYTYQDIPIMQCDKAEVDKLYCYRVDVDMLNKMTRCPKCGSCNISEPHYHSNTYMPPGFDKPIQGELLVWRCCRCGFEKTGRCLDSLDKLKEKFDTA